MRIVFISWRDLAHPQAGGSEVVLDHLATGLQARAHDVALFGGEPVGERPYPVLANGVRTPNTCGRRTATCAISALPPARASSSPATSTQHARAETARHRAEGVTWEHAVDRFEAVVRDAAVPE